MSILYLVATPIGNLGDLSHRAVEVLRSVPVIAAEDTRTTKTLLDHYQISTAMISYHEHSQENRITSSIAMKRARASSPLVSSGSSFCASFRSLRRTLSTQIILLTGKNSMSARSTTEI